LEGSFTFRVVFFVYVVYLFVSSLGILFADKRPTSTLKDASFSKPSQIQKKREKRGRGRKEVEKTGYASVSCGITSSPPLSSTLHAQHQHTHTHTHLLSRAALPSPPQLPFAFHSTCLHGEPKRHRTDPECDATAASPHET
jgi:hypothetical protein